MDLVLRGSAWLTLHTHLPQDVAPIFPVSHDLNVIISSYLAKQICFLKVAQL